MSWLVDTDLLSERAKKRPDPSVLEWLEQNSGEIYTSSHVIAEIRAGVSLLAEGARKRALQAWLSRLVEAMEGRILNFNTSVAMVWADQEADFSRKGCLMPMPDSFIAATARRYNLTVATRNTGDYARPGLKVVNPVARRARD
jgi:predicted nucleic acid-binding protein